MITDNPVYRSKGSSAAGIPKGAVPAKKASGLHPVSAPIPKVVTVIEYPAYPPSFSDDKNRTPPDSHHSAARNSGSLYFEGSGYNLYHRHHTPIQCRQKIQQAPFHSVPKHSCPAA